MALDMVSAPAAPRLFCVYLRAYIAEFPDKIARRRLSAHAAAAAILWNLEGPLLVSGPGQGTVTVLRRGLCTAAPLWCGLRCCQC